MRAFLLSLIVPLLGACAPNASRSIEATAGVVDLRGVDLSRQIVSLDGQWLFQWKNRSPALLVRQPSSWVNAHLDGRALPREGFGTYSLRILLDPDASVRGHLVLSTKEINAASRIWINGTRLADIGSGRLRQTLPADTDIVQLRVEVSNRWDPSPGIPCPLLLGSDRNMGRRDQLNLGVQAFLIGIFLIFSAFYLMGWIHRPRAFSSLLLGLSTLSWAVFSFFQGVEIAPAEIFFPSLSAVFVQKGYLLATAAIYPLTCMLWLGEFPAPLLRRLMPLLVGVSALFAGALLATGPIHWNWLFWYLAVGNVFLMILLWFAVCAVRRKVPDSDLFLVGLIGFYAVVLYGSIVLRGESIGFGGLCLVLAHALVLSRRHASAIDTIDRQRRELERVGSPREESLPELSNLAVPVGAFAANRQEIGCQAMRLALETWIACTGLTKIDFAESSGLWRVHMDTSGWRRALTLDRYLVADKFPAHPKWRKILDSVDHVLATCEDRQWRDDRIQRLKEARSQLENQVKP